MASKHSKNVGGGLILALPFGMTHSQGRAMRWVFLLLVLLAGLSACQDEVIPEEYPPYQTDKKPLLVLLSAVWSEYAGVSGIPYFYSAVSDSFDFDVVPIVAHASTIGDPFYSLAASQFFGLYQAENFPELGLNAKGYGYRTVDWLPEVRASKFDTTGGTPALATPAAVMSIIKRIEGRDVKIKVRVRIEKALTNKQLNLGVYVTENRVVAYQEGIGVTFDHFYVLRGAATPGAWGVNLGSGSFAVGQVLEYEGSFPINPFMNANNLIVNAVLFDMQNNEPQDVLNAHYR